MSGNDPLHQAVFEPVASIWGRAASIKVLRSGRLIVTAEASSRPAHCGDKPLKAPGVAIARIGPALPFADLYLNRKHEADPCVTLESTPFDRVFRFYMDPQNHFGSKKVAITRS